ncbi:MAG: protein kinase [Candidatus Krumholzibacteriota bacterium]|nr:protein kinase [Candidatus Krumholzibacteriota bacterium]
MIGRTISHYRITARLGAGGMGEVYQAEDTKLGRTVALKFLPPEFSQDPGAKARFVQEARAASALDHPNVCTIFEVDETEDGRIFIAMACYAGETLKERIARGPLPLDNALDISRQIAGGLGKAHEREIVHRDIKPANIFVTADGLVKILDFGVAKLKGQAQMTRTGTTLGTAAYMSPEQARGEEVNQRTDIWSLGAVLYEMITGRAPFGGEHEAAVIYAIMNEVPEPVTGLRSGIPLELERIILKCLARDARERYQSAADLSADLFHLEKDALRKGVTRTAASRKPSRRRLNWTAWILSSLLLALLIIQVIPRFFAGQKEGPERSAADDRTRLVVLSFENLGPPEDDYFADGITEEITSRLAALQELGVISRKSALHYKDSDKTISEIGVELDVDYVLEGTVRWEQSPGGGSRVRVTPQLIRVSDDSHIWAEQYDEQFAAIFEIQSRIAEQVAARLDIALSGGEQNFIAAKPTENIVAYQIYLRAADHILFGQRPEVNYRRAEELLKQAIDIDPCFALAHAKLSHVNRSFYFYGYDRTENRLRIAKEEIDRAVELDPKGPEVRRELGYYYYQGLLDYDRALQEFVSLAGTLPSDAQLLMDIAFIWRRQGHIEQALANLQTAYAMSPMDAVLSVELANTYLTLRNPAKTLEYADKSIAIDPQDHWGYFIKSGAYVIGMGDVRRAWETLEACPDKTAMPMIWGKYYLHLFDRDYQAVLDMFEGSAFDVVYLQNSYLPVSMLKGNACRLMGDSGRAVAFYGEALVLLEDAVRENPEDPRIHSSLGTTYAGLGRKEEAIAAGRKAMEIYPITMDAILGVDRLLDMAEIYTVSGENDAAIRLIREILSMPAIYTIRCFELDPRYDGLRDEPEYQQLVREFGGK